MRKRMMRPISKCTKKHKSDKYKKDWISQLPDEILVSVLSLLGIREAARTCVLSKRWERVWLHSYHSVLNFDALETIIYLDSNLKALEVERSRYIRWVNNVLDSHRDSTIDEFRVAFCLNNSSSCAIDRWIEFAIAKRVQRLEVNLKPLDISFWKETQLYTFPIQSYIHIKNPAGLSNIRSLRSLCFKHVSISGEILEYFLSNCPLLESLRVERSEHLVNLKVFGSSLRLKFLEISFCKHLKDLEVCATSLVSFKYIGVGKRVNMQIKDAFQLAWVSSADYLRAIEYAFLPLSSYFSQLETLTLGMFLRKGSNTGFRQLPEFTKLKHLTLDVSAEQCASLLGWTTLINASPLLQKFTLQLNYMNWRNFQRGMHEVHNHPHRCLKEVELAGFVGHPIDLELAKYLIKNAVMLEKIIIDRHRVLDTEEKQYAKERATELQENLPARVVMEII